jgi:ATP-GRASP peptide maturase of grasp-with-spasm system
MHDVLIFSTDRDVTTSKVMAWINCLNPLIKIFRINDSQKKLNYLLFDIKTNNDLKLNQFEVKKNTRIWYRSGVLFRYSNFSNIDSLNYLCGQEFSQIVDFIGYKLESSDNCLGSILGEKYINKLIVLDKAKQIGMKIPKMFLSNFNSILPKCSFEWISKSVSNLNPINYGDYRYFPVYQKISDLNTEDCSLTYCQEYVEKLFEIRTFFLRGSFFSMAIFSQQSSKTKVDYRNYDRENPNRKVPIKLPATVRIMLNKLMSELDLNTGSIDLVVTPDYEYYFLEVNPCGQIDWLSESCNYFLEKEIAKSLVI